MKLIGIIRKTLAGLLSAALLTVLVPAAAVRADASLGMNVSGNTEVGGTVTVSVSVSGGGPFSGFDGSFSYDSGILELQSITSGNYTKVNYASSGNRFLEGNANIPDGATIVKATFICKAQGTTTVSCSLDDLADINVSPVAVSGASKTISISTPVPKSANASLSGLTISPGTLSPAFSSGTQSYTAAVDAAQSKITVSAVPADSKAKVSLNGVQKSLAVGKNTVKITVTAEDGTTKVYTVIVTRASGPTGTPTPTAAPLPLMSYDGDDYMILTAGTSDSIPDDFTAASAKYKGVDIPVLQKTLGDAVDASVMSIVLLTSEGQNRYFVYDPAAETIYPYQVISSSSVSLQVFGGRGVSSVPEGYEAFDYLLQDIKVTAYRLASDPENPQILLYLMDGSGICSFYYYDTQNGMLMQYRGAVEIIDATPTPTPTAAPSEAEALLPTDAGAVKTAGDGEITFRSLLDYSNPVVLVVYTVALVCMALAAACICLAHGRRRRAWNENDFAAEYENEPGAFNRPVISPFMIASPDTDDWEDPDETAFSKMDPRPVSTTPAVSTGFDSTGTADPFLSKSPMLDFPEIPQRKNVVIAPDFAGRDLSGFPAKDQPSQPGPEIPEEFPPLLVRRVDTPAPGPVPVPARNDPEAEGRLSQNLGSKPVPSMKEDLPKSHSPVEKRGATFFHEPDAREDDPDFDPFDK